MVRVQILIPLELLEKLREVRKNKDISVSEQVRRMLEDQIQRMAKEGLC